MSDPFLPDTQAFDKNDPNPCAGCSHCCEYMALEIDRPVSAKDFDQIRWYLLHKNVWVYVDDENDWHVQFNTPCEKLELQRCSYYEGRPQICRDYEPMDCVRYGEGEAEKFLFKNETDLFRYLKKRRPVTYRKLRDGSEGDRPAVIPQLITSSVTSDK